MPRFKTPDCGLKLIPIDFAQQVLPGTFEFALCHLVDHEVDLFAFRARYANDGDCTINGYAATRYSGAGRDCVPCDQRQRCLRTPDKTKVRQVAFFRGKRNGEESHTDRMKRRIDSTEGKRMIAARFATVEPVSGNLRHNKRLARFTLRGRQKVDGQWKLYCLVHNIEKLGHHGYAN